MSSMPEVILSSILLLCSSLMLMILHPIMMIILLNIYTILISVDIYFNLFSPWFSYILILMMTGGLLILFIYMASLVPNEPLFSKNFPLLIFLLMIISLLLSSHSNNFSPQNLQITLFNLYPPIIIFLILYLFILLFMLTIIVQNNMGPLRL